MLTCRPMWQKSTLILYDQLPKAMQIITWQLQLVLLTCCCWPLPQVAGLMVENTFMSVMDMVPRIVPPLGLLIGTGKPLNFLVTNKWHNMEQIRKLSGLPMLLLASRQVRPHASCRVCWKG